MKAKARWYNEGEKSNKYFFNLLKRRSESSEVTKLNINGTIMKKEKEIRNRVTEFYTELYNIGTTPGPDGISNLYIKKLWYILGPVILDAWNYSLETKTYHSHTKHHYSG